MNLNLTPVEINIDIETLSLERDAFYNVCFITENDTAPRTLEVSNLNDLLKNGFTRDSLAYNFCVGVFAQQKIPYVTIRSKRTNETYEQAFDADSNDGYYFIVIESKDLIVISNFNEYLTSADSFKLQFYSSDSETLTNNKIVHYYNPKDLNLTDGKLSIRDYYINKAYKLGYEVEGSDTTSVEQYQTARLAYPEGAWISVCGNSFPSRVQWLHKFLIKSDLNTLKNIPDLSTTSARVVSSKATAGSGSTAQGVVIHEQVSLDWVRWALSRKVWNTLYSKSKVSATQGGVDLIVNDVKQVLDVAVQEGVFSEYRITETKLNRMDNTISLKFTAMFVQSILNLEVNGTLHY